jgi:acetylornithine deacetylase/succinyl-diaminopimelate desuccinylase-like protein
MKIAHVAEDKNPVVLGRLGREPGLPTIAFYGHYDVQVLVLTPCAEPSAC